MEEDKPFVESMIDRSQDNFELHGRDRADSSVFQGVLEQPTGETLFEELKAGESPPDELGKPSSMLNQIAAAEIKFPKSAKPQRRTEVKKP